VDHVEGAAGQLAAVLGLRWSIEGQPGHWGLGTDAVGPSPSVPEPLPAEPEPGDPGPPLPEEETDLLSPLEPTPTGEDELGPVAPTTDVGSDVEATTGAPPP